jgi:hypothetical protein
MARTAGGEWSPDFEWITTRLRRAAGAARSSLRHESIMNMHTNLQKLSVILAVVAAFLALGAGISRYARRGEFEVVPFAAGALLLALAVFFATQARGTGRG